MNAYFKLNTKEDGVFLLLIPETNGGKGIDFKELNEYLIQNNIEFDKKIIMNESIGFRESKEIKLSSQKIYPVDEKVILNINIEKTIAEGRFYPPSNGGKMLTSEDIVYAMQRSGVKYGIKEENISSFLNERKYCTDYELASYLAPVQGRPSKVTYYFNTDLSRKPKTNEDGSVDFHQLDNISTVEKGAVIATLQPGIIGKPGIDVQGGIIQPVRFEQVKLRHGKNIHLSEDGLTMYSEVSGHAMLVDGKVYVEDTYEVKGDVDASTGDIQYEGNVKIKGSVRTGYEVKAKGDIIVEGVVEGATLIAGGQIILTRGIQGMNKGFLKAEGNIVSKFIESASIDAGGYITTDAIMHSKVTARGDVVVNGKKGFIIGGEIRSTTMIYAKTAGSTMGTNTLLEVGADPSLLEEYRTMEKEIPALQTELDKVIQILTLFAKKIKAGEPLTNEKIEYIRTLKNTKDSYEERLTALKSRYNKLSELIDNNEGACVKISSTIYPGCKVVISNVIYYIRSEMARCCLIRDRADVKVCPL